MKNRGIMTEIYYPLPVHKQPYYQQLYFDNELPSAEKAAMEVISLPIHPDLKSSDLEYIISSLRSITKS